ncbi:epoxyqueuosine reductase [Eubacteriaceae bacterium ES2]|nr:epoxyqueuosine reductase [Eubacteriaceae bacterium ES2]
MNKKMIEMITEYVKGYQGLKNTESEWRDPIIGFADAQDDLFPKLKEIIGPAHSVPADIIPRARSVIVFFLPFSEEIIGSNISGENGSRAWDMAKIETNLLIEDLNRYLYEQIIARGYKASLLPATYNYDEDKLISDWSHRSVAYIAGIGTFGINNMLITKSGCCGRIGSVITDMPLVPTERPKEEYCLYKFNGSCKKCHKQCVADALDLSENRVLFERNKCNGQINKNVPVYANGVGDTCGKCMVNLPCSLRIPLTSGY